MHDTDLVVLDVVLFEHHGEWYTDGQVGKDGKQAIGADPPECQVVSDLMDGEESVLICRCSNDVSESPELE
jgi:hypothetical protein